MDFEYAIKALETEYANEMRKLQSSYDENISGSEFESAESLLKDIYILIGKRDALKDLRKKTGLKK